MTNKRHSRRKTKGIVEEKQKGSADEEHKALQTKNKRHCWRKTKGIADIKHKALQTKNKKEFQTKNKRHCRRKTKGISDEKQKALQTRRQIDLSLLCTLRRLWRDSNRAETCFAGFWRWEAGRSHDPASSISTLLRLGRRIRSISSARESLADAWWLGRLNELVTSERVRIEGEPRIRKLQFAIEIRDFPLYADTLVDTLEDCVGFTYWKLSLRIIDYLERLAEIG